MPTNDPRPTKSQRREEARIKAQQMRLEQERKARRTRLIAIGGLLAAVAVLAAVVLVIVREGQANVEAYADVTYASGAPEAVAPAFDDVEVPEVADAAGGIPVSADGVGTTGEDDVVVEVYFDFMCPYCGQFDAANAAALDTLAENEDVTVVYKAISFLDGNSRGTFYSTRAANAAAVVAAESPEHYSDFVTALFANQPKEGSTGLKDARIKEIAVEVGVPQEVADSFTETVDGTFEVDGEDGTQTREGTWRRYAPFVAATTQQAGVDLGKLSTPTVRIDGETFQGDLYSTGALTQAVLDAVAAKG